MPPRSAASGDAAEHQRTSRDWQLVVLNGEAGLAAFCELVRAAWARGEQVWQFDGMLSACRQEPTGAQPAGIVRGREPGLRSWQMRLSSAPAPTSADGGAGVGEGEARP